MPLNAKEYGKQRKKKKNPINQIHHAEQASSAPIDLHVVQNGATQSLEDKLPEKTLYSKVVTLQPKQAAVTSKLDTQQDPKLPLNHQSTTPIECDEDQSLAFATWDMVPNTDSDAAMDNPSSTIPDEPKEASASSTSAIQAALDLPRRYEARKATNARFFNSFIPTDSKRPEEIKFITLIAEKLTNKGNITQLINAAYLCVMQDIKTSYEKAWVYKDASGSQLYVELTEQTANMTSDEQIDCLEQLSTVLQNEDTQRQINLDSIKTAHHLTTIDSLIAALNKASLATLEA